MIRRDVVDRDGRSAWLLVSQLEHARIAAETAAVWNDEFGPLVEPRDAFVAMVRKHDDGWAVWEQRPEVCGGRPRDFMEMPLDEALAVYRRSIAVATTISRYAGTVVGAHFRHLVQLSSEKHEAKHDWARDVEHLAEDFLDEQDGLRREFVEAAPSADRDRAEADVERGLHLLQFFDFASLWLCCADRTEPQTLVGPERLIKTGPSDDTTSGERIEFRFIPSGRTEDGRRRVTIAPWPLRVPSLDLTVVGRLVPIADYASAESLAAAGGESQELTWRLEPGD